MSGRARFPTNGRWTATVIRMEKNTGVRKTRRKKAEEDGDGEAIGAEEGGDVQQDKWPQNGRMTSGNTRDEGKAGRGRGGRARTLM